MLTRTRAALHYVMATLFGRNGGATACPRVKARPTPAFAAAAVVALAAAAAADDDDASVSCAAEDEGLHTKPVRKQRGRRRGSCPATLHTQIGAFQTVGSFEAQSTLQKQIR